VLKLIALAAMVVAVALASGVGSSDLRAGADTVRSGAKTILWGTDGRGDEHDRQDADPEETEERNGGSEP
jgi:hypothetical protein